MSWRRGELGIVRDPCRRKFGWLLSRETLCLGRTLRRRGCTVEDDVAKDKGKVEGNGVWFRHFQLPAQDRLSLRELQVANLAWSAQVVLSFSFSFVAVYLLVYSYHRREKHQSQFHQFNFHYPNSHQIFVPVFRFFVFFVFSWSFLWLVWHIEVSVHVVEGA